ncbi:MAG TPA: hypothetical protein VL137_08850, partial [Polyangiaceae bacterium]|nr:hypothetical protein [Polyangiaceae bacterium]
MHRLLTLPLIASLLLFGAVAKAQVVILPPDRANVTVEEGEAVRSILADAYADVEKGKVILAPVSAAESQDPPNKIATDLGGKQFITLRATRLSERIVLTAALYSADGQEIHRVRMTAASLDDIEPVTARMAKALHDGTNTDESITIDTVTEREGQKRNRTFSEKVMGVKTSVTGIIARGSYEPMVAVEFDGRLEAQSYFLEFGAGFQLPTGGSGSSDRQVGGVLAEIGASYYLTHTSVSPYVGGGVMPRLLAGDPSGANLALYAQAGAMFFRESSSRLYADFRVAQNVTPWSRESFIYLNGTYTTE